MGDVLLQEHVSFLRAAATSVEVNGNWENLLDYERAFEG